MKEHNYIYDYIRLIACIFVIGIHVSDGLMATKTGGGYTVGCIYQTLFRIGLPIFFMLSGALMLNSKKEETLSQFYISRFYKVVLPFILYSLFYASIVNTEGGSISEKLLSIHFLIGQIKYIPKYIVNILGNVQYFHLWFMYSIIGLYLLIPFLKVMVQNMNEKMLINLITVIFILRIIINYFPVIGFKIHISDFTFSGWVFYLFAGYIIIQPFMKNRLNFVACIGIIGIILSFIIKRWFPDFATISKNFYDLAPLMILEVCGMFSIFIINEKKITSNNTLNKIVGKLSSYTFSIYMAHGFIYNRVIKKGLTVHTYNDIFGTIISIVVIFIISLIFSIVFDNIIVKPVTYIIRKLTEFVKMYAVKLYLNKNLKGI